MVQLQRLGRGRRRGGEKLSSPHTSPRHCEGGCGRAEKPLPDSRFQTGKSNRVLPARREAWRALPWREVPTVPLCTCTVGAAQAILPADRIAGAAGGPAARDSVRPRAYAEGRLCRQGSRGSPAKPRDTQPFSRCLAGAFRSSRWRGDGRPFRVVTPDTAVNHRHGCPTPPSWCRC